MESTNFQLDNHLLGEIVNNAVRITRSNRACLLLYDRTFDRLECRYGENCSHFKEATRTRCVVAVQDSPLQLRELLNGYHGSGYIAESKEFQTKKQNEATNSCSQMLIPMVSQSLRL